MTPFIPVVRAKLMKASDGFSVTGERTYAPAVTVGINIVRLATDVTATSVRADKSGTKSYADEQLTKGRILVHPRFKAAEDDLVEIFGVQYKITGVRAVVSMDGKIDHYQAEL